MTHDFEMRYQSAAVHAYKYTSHVHLLCENYSGIECLAI